MTRLIARAAPAAALLAALAAVSARAGDGVTNVRNADECAAVHQVEITSKFEPASISVRQGECIHFTNTHNIEHSAVGAEREFNTGIMMPGGTALLRFDAPGEIPYICGVHPPMTALLTVTAAE